MNKTCPSCGKALPPDAPGGLCPQCLLAGGLESDPNKTSDYTPFAAPSVAEIAALFPQLEILELLGAGGMGAVYKARQPALDRFVALKILPKRDDPAFAERFTREARALAKLSHPGIVTVHDFGQASDLYYFVMEYVEGVNLRQAERGKLSPSEALAIVPQICAALQFAHDAGVVHRDIKPENILLDAKGRVKIADFGLAKLSGKDGPNPLTHTHQVMGTMHYMAPEQWEKPAEVDHRADIYSLGVVFYELLTGELPLGRFPLPSERVQVDVRLDDIVLRTLEKQPERRYQHASEVKTDVEKIQTVPAAAAPTAMPPRPKRSIASFLALTIALLMLLSCAGAFSLMFFPVVDVLVDVKSIREQLIGKWLWIGREGWTAFHADGTFEEKWREMVMGTTDGALDPEKPWVETDFHVGGQYRWIGGDRIETKSPGRPDNQFRVVVKDDELTVLKDDGGVQRMQRQSADPAGAKSETQQKLFGSWKSTVGALRYEFTPEGTFNHWARVKPDPQSPEVEKRVSGRYRWQDEHLIEFRAADGSEGEILELHFANENSTWSVKGQHPRIKFVREHDGFVVLKDSGEVGARLKREQANLIP